MSSSKGANRAAVVLGALAVLAIPAALAVQRWAGGITLLRSLYIGVPAAFVLALAAISASRRARYARARSVRPSGGRWGTFLAWAGLYAAAVGGIALAVYAVLRAAQ
jgi:hypothetical protein